METLISIIIPVYKCEKHIDNCVQSIMDQTYTNLEIILVDDGSPDNSGKICDEYAKRDSRIVVIHQKNGGVSAARNAGIACSTGEYIMFVDSDDWVDKTIVQHLYSNLEEKNADMSICRHYTVIDNTHFQKSLCEAIYVSGDKEIADYVHNQFNTAPIRAPWATLYKRGLVGNFLKEMEFGEDTLFKIDCFERAKTVVVSDRMLYYYNTYETPDSLTKKFSSNRFDYYLILHARALDMLNSKGGITKKQAIYANYNLVSNVFLFMRKYCAQNNNGKAQREYIYLVCKNDIVQEALKNVFVARKKENIKILLMKHKMIRCLQLLCNILNKKQGW